jgi:hypothetical protein
MAEKIYKETSTKLLRERIHYNRHKLFTIDNEIQDLTALLEKRVEQNLWST